MAVRNFIADIFVAADRPFEMAADEINKLIAPHKLESTDRFDEVPGFATEFEGVEVELQGIPQDVITDETRPERFYYLNIRLQLDELSKIPRWLGIEGPIAPNVECGWMDLSMYLRRQVEAVTTLRCVE